MEVEETWLKEAGLSFLVSGITSSEASLPLPEAVISTLTHQQAAIVRTRLDTYNETLRKRNRQPLRDVREIFAEVGMHRSNASPAVYSGNVKNIIIFSALA